MERSSLFALIWIKSPNKSEREYNALQIVESLGIAPKPFHFESLKQHLGETFIILEYLEGKSLEQYTNHNEEIVKQLGKIVAQLHNTNIHNRGNYLERYGSSKTDLLQEIKQRIEYITTKRRVYFPVRDKFEEILNKTYRTLKSINFHMKPSYVLGHGDIAPQNVIFSEGKLKLIDWEDLRLIDPALEIAIIFDAFDYSEKEQELFLNEYLAIREDPSLTTKIPILFPFQLFGVFCWAIMHIYDIGEGEMHEDFLKEQNLKDHIEYAKKMFTKCKEEGIISKNIRWNISEIIPETYLT